MSRSFYAAVLCVAVLFFNTASGQGVNPGTISGVPSICAGANAIYTSNGDAGGMWSSSDPSVATIDANGLIKAVSAGNATITYSIGVIGDGAVFSSKNIIVNPVPVAPVVTVLNDCSQSTLTASGYTGTLLWSTGETYSFIRTSTAGIYTVTQTENGCTSQPGSGTAAPKPTPVAPSISAQRFCDSRTILTAYNYTGTLLWSDGETTPSIRAEDKLYYVVQTVDGCRSPPSEEVSGSMLGTPSPPLADVTNNCDGTSTLRASSDNVYGSEVFWNTPDNQRITGQVITVTKEGQYTAGFVTYLGCYSFPSSVVVAYPKHAPPAPVITITSNSNGTTTLTASGYTGDLLWSTGETTAAITVTGGGTFSVTQTVDRCISVAATVTVTTDIVHPVLTVPSDTTMRPCNAQLIFSVYRAWLAEAVYNKGACGGDLVSTATSSDVPGFYCFGGSVTVTWSYTDICDGTTVTKTARFTVSPPPPIIFSVPDDKTVGPCLNSSEINDLYNGWVNSASVSGGCGVSIFIKSISGSISPEGGTRVVSYGGLTLCGGDANGPSRSFTVLPDAPVIHTPPDKIENAGQTQDAINASFNAWLASATVTGSCHSNFFPLDYSPPPATGGSVTVRWRTALPKAGEISASATFTVLAPPLHWITLPNALDRSVVCNDAEGLVAAQSLAAVATTTADCGTITYFKTSGEFVHNSCGAGGTYSNTWIAMDGCENRTTYTQMITVVDAGPALKPGAVLPGQINVNTCLANAPLPAASSIAMLFKTCSGGNTTATLISSSIDGNNCDWKVTYGYRITDECGNFTITFITYSGGDKTAPVITLASATKLSCNPTRAQIEAAFGTATVTDNCSQNFVAIGNVGTETTTGSTCNYSTTKTWTVTDACGNTATATQTLTYIKGIAAPPVIHCPADVNTDCSKGNTSPSSTGMATATAGCGSVTISYSDVVVITRRNGNAISYTISRTWKAADVCGNTSTCTQIIKVDDNKRPNINCPPDKIISCSESTAPSHIGTPSVSDNCDPDPAVTYSDNSDFDVNPNKPKHYNYTIIRTWTATDEMGNQRICQQQIRVQDVIAPVIICPPNITVNASTNCTANVAAGTPTATDNCSPVTISGKRSDGKALTSSYPAGNTIITWTATDVSGNKATCTQTITVKVNYTFTCPAPVTAFTNNGCTARNVAIGNPTISDPCDVLTVSNDHPSATYPLGTTIVTWTFKDAMGKTNTCTQAVTVKDNVNPTINCPPQIFKVANSGCNATGVVLTPPTTSDNCSVASVTNDHPSTTYPKGNTVVTWTVTDGRGNKTSCTQIVTVTDNVKPSITCPANITVTATSLAGAVVRYPSPVASDNCSAITVTQNEGKPSGSVFPFGVTTNTFTVRDGNGNSSTCSFTITVKIPFCDDWDVYVCHQGTTICVSVFDALFHLQHGDDLGQCTGSNQRMDNRITDANIPRAYTLINYPNPLSNFTRIEYGLPVDSKVSLQVFDLMGRDIATLTNANQNAGIYKVDFDASKLSSGVYYYRLSAFAQGKQYVQTQKMVIIH